MQDLGGYSILGEIRYGSRRVLSARVRYSRIRSYGTEGGRKDGESVTEEAGEFLTIVGKDSPQAGAQLDTQCPGRYPIPGNAAFKLVRTGNVLCNDTCGSAETSPGY